MIIPIVCFSCSDVISGKYELYLEKVEKYRKESGKKAFWIKYWGII
jgi:DNA-directed RNA polymerase subunit N (RpoN/RPB10)